MNAGGGGSGGGSGGGAGAGGAGGGIGGGVRGDSGFSGARIGGAERAGGLGIGIGGRGLGEAAPVSGLARFDNGPAFGAASTLGGVKAEGFNFGPEWARAEIGGGPQVKEGPAGRAGLENTMPLQIGQDKPVKEIRFNNPVKGSASNEPFSAQSVIAEAEAIVSQAQKNPTSQAVSGQPVAKRAVPVEVDYQLNTVKPVEKTAVLLVDNYLYDRTPKWYALPHPVFAPALKPVTEAGRAVQPKTEGKVSSKTASAVSVKPTPKEQEEVMEEKVLVDQKEEDLSGIDNDEKVAETKVRIVEAEEVTQERGQEIETGVGKLAGMSMIGRRLKEVLSRRFWEAKSPLVGDKKDWTIDLIIQDIEADTTEYETQEQALKAWVKVSKKHIPVRKGQVGRTATVEEVNKVIHGRKDWLTPKTPAEIVIKRLVKKSLEQTKSGEVRVLDDKNDTKVEGSLKDLGLEGVFLQKAA